MILSKSLRNFCWSNAFLTKQLSAASLISDVKFLACVDNPVSLTQYHSGRFTGKGWSCCKAATFRSSPGCKPSTIYGKQMFLFSSVLPRALERINFTNQESTCSRWTCITPFYDLCSRSQAMMRTYELWKLSKQNWQEHISSIQEQNENITLRYHR